MVRIRIQEQDQKRPGLSRIRTQGRIKNHQDQAGLEPGSKIKNDQDQAGQESQVSTPDTSDLRRIQSARNHDMINQSPERGHPCPRTSRHLPFSTSRANCFLCIRNSIENDGARTSRFRRRGQDALAPGNANRTGPRTDIDRVERTLLSAHVHSPRALQSNNHARPDSPTFPPRKKRRAIYRNSWGGQTGMSAPPSDTLLKRIDKLTS